MVEVSARGGHGTSFNVALRAVVPASFSLASAPRWSSYRKADVQVTPHSEPIHMILNRQTGYAKQLPNRAVALIGGRNNLSGPP